MRRTGIERAALVAVMAMVCAGSACEALVGIEDTTEVSVRVTAAGVLAPLSLELRHTGGSEILTVSQDGGIAFRATLNRGESYTVVFVGEPPCVLEDRDRGDDRPDGRGRAVLRGRGQADRARDLRAHRARAGLAPDELAYVADVSLQQQSTTVTATAAFAEAAITVQGAAVTSGVPGEPVALPMLETVVSIDVTHPSGFARQYQVTIRRAVDRIAQHVYGKASSTGAGDLFGVSVALDGDTLVVGATREDSAATGVNGDQTDNSAGGSGAVYVFRRSGTQWQQEAYIKASNTGANDLFGVSVALDGDTLAVGAMGEASAATGVNGNQADNSAPESGAVYIFH
jgi:trimeric autotransporter adhesin